MSKKSDEIIRNGTIDDIVDLFRQVFIDKVKKPKVRKFKCSCGKTYEVATNIYDNSDSGQGRCDCGDCVTIIN